MRVKMKRLGSKIGWEIVGGEWPEFKGGLKGQTDSDGISDQNPLD